MSPRISRAPSAWFARRRGARGASHLSEGTLQRTVLLPVASRRERFDLAEPVPGPTTTRHAGARARAGRGAHRAVLRARDGGRLSQLGGRDRRRRHAAGHLPQDAHSGRPALLREVLLHARRRAAARRARSERRGGLQGVAHALRDDRRPDLLGPVVSGSRAHHRARSAPTCSSIRRRSAGTRSRRTSGAPRRSMRGGRCNGRTRSPTACTWPRPIASDTKTSPARTASRSSAIRSSPIRPAASSRRRRSEEAILIATCDPAFVETTRRNWPFLRDRRIDAYGPILRRRLGA